MRLFDKPLTPIKPLSLKQPNPYVATASSTRTRNLALPQQEEESMLKGIGDIAAFPQRKATEMVTGTYQDPSEALGIENWAGALAVDMIADPLNLIGAGIGTKAMKAFRKGDKVAEATAMMSKATDKTIDVVPIARQEAEAGVEKANEWLKNWYSNRRTQLENFTPLYDYQTEKLGLSLQRIRPDKNFDEIIENEPWVAKLSPIEKQKYFSRNFGVSTFDPNALPDEGIVIPKEPNKSGAYNMVDYVLGNDYYLSGVHEGTHGMDFVSELTTELGEVYTTINGKSAIVPNPWGKRLNWVEEYKRSDNSTKVAMLNSKNIPILDEMHILVKNKLEKELVSIDGYTKVDDLNTIEYLSNPAEIYARLNELRAYTGLKPTDYIDETKALEILSQIENNSNPFLNSVKVTFQGLDPKTLAKWLNIMPAAGGAAVLTNQNQ
jgi:hypothetical protein